jgi:hypothetical protein
MLVSYNTNQKKFRKVYFLSGNPTTGSRVVLDPKDFSEMQDIWLEQLDNFVKAIRGVDSGVVDGCEVVVQAKSTGGFEIVVAPGKFYVNSTMVQLVQAHAIDIPIPSWSGNKVFYFIAKPVIKTFIPTVIGEPGFSTLAGRPTSNRAEIAFELELVDTLPEDWHVIFCAVRIGETLATIDDIEILYDDRNELMEMKDIQEAAVYAKALIDEHLTFYFDKQIVAESDGVTTSFELKYPVMAGSEVKVFADDIEITNFTIETVGDWLNNEKPVSTLTLSAPVQDSLIIKASYFPDHHVQYLSRFRFSEHIGAESIDHDNRYYTEAEIDAWRITHNQDVDAHPTHVLWTDFNAWVEQHTSSTTTDHDNAYTRIGHGHTIDDVNNLRGELVMLSQQIGYGSDDYYIVTQQITENVDGVNTLFTVSNSLIDSGVGYVKSVRADITNDAVKNPAVLKVIDATEEFETPSVGAFSEPKLLSQRNLNGNPSACVQLDDEVWAVWSAKETEDISRIWFASYKQGDGYFSPATSTGLPCNPDSRVSATVVYSVNPTINQRIVIVWNYNDQLYYSHIDKGQTEWINAVPLPNTSGASDAAVCWVNDGVTASGRLHVLYTKEAGTGKMAIYKKMYEIDLLEVDDEVNVTFGDINEVHPVIVQDTSTSKRVWYGWIAREENVGGDYDNSCTLKYKIVDKYSPTVYQPVSVLGGISDLNIASGLSFSPQPSGMWVQFSVFESGQFNIYYQEFDFAGSIINPRIYLEKGTQVSAVVSSDNVVWSIYQYLSSIYYRARENGAGEVKWNIATKELEFENAPVSIPIFVDIAVPLQSLNKRVSRLESDVADTEELVAQRIRDVIESMGLNIPQERMNMMREKMIVEANTDIDSRRIALNYDKVIYNKFFDATSGLPDGINSVVLKNGSPVLFIESGLVHDSMGKIINPTGQIMKIYTKIYDVDFLCDGHLRVEANGDIECLAFRITSKLTNTPSDPAIDWWNIADAQLSQDLNLSGDANFVTNHNYGVEIEILPGGWIYDWAIFMNGSAI